MAIVAARVLKANFLSNTSIANYVLSFMDGKIRFTSNDVDVHAYGFDCSWDLSSGSRNFHINFEQIDVWAECVVEVREGNVTSAIKFNKPDSLVKLSCSVVEIAQKAAPIEHHDATRMRQAFTLEQKQALPFMEHGKEEEWIFAICKLCDNMGSDAMRPYIQSIKGVAKLSEDAAAKCNTISDVLFAVGMAADPRFNLKWGALEQGEKETLREYRDRVKRYGFVFGKSEKDVIELLKVTTTIGWRNRLAMYAELKLEHIDNLVKEEDAVLKKEVAIALINKEKADKEAAEEEVAAIRTFNQRKNVQWQSNSNHNRQNGGDRNQQRNFNGNSRNIIRCYNCQQPGHIARECPQKQQPRNQSRTFSKN
jgi:hypothetical protein